MVHVQEVPPRIVEKNPVDIAGIFGASGAPDSFRYDLVGRYLKSLECVDEVLIHLKVGLFRVAIVGLYGAEEKEAYRRPQQ